jgi:hypothetical protein
MPYIPVAEQEISCVLNQMPHFESQKKRCLLPENKLMIKLAGQVLAFPANIIICCLAFYFAAKKIKYCHCKFKCRVTDCG